ncbi:hypothetical protein KEM55_006236 [Ascosphaera atra]|nr:hypothetical protein KEM55_006236 [Ascosphaera atra]
MVRHALRGCSPAQRRICVLALVTVGLLFFIANSLRATTPRRIQPSGGSRPLDSSVVSAHAYFWQNFKPILERHAPTCPPPERTKTAQGQRYDANNAKAQRPNYMLMPGRDVDEMRTKHAGFVKAITTSPITPYHRPGTRGLVTTAGGPYLPIFAVSLRMLRRTGSTLPVEVFLADAKEYEPYICDVVFRDLNARCVVLDEILSHGTDTTTAGDQKDDKKQIKSYQFKPLAMLFSSFEELMFIDADAFPLHDPQLIFDSALFKRFQLITRERL